MSGVNKVLLIGNVGQEPEIRSTQEGRPVASFSFATNERWKDRSTGEVNNKTEWHRVVTFQEGLTKVIQDYVHKGAKLYIEGSLRTRKWTDSNGIEKYSTEVVIGYSGTINILSPREGGGGNGRGSDYGGNDYGNSGYNQSNTSSNGGSNGYSKQSSSSNSSAPDAFDNMIDDDIPF